MKQAEAVQKLEAAFSQLGKAKDEIMTELEKLRSSDPDLSPEGSAAVEKISGIAQAIDDVIADQPPQ